MSYCVNCGVELAPSEKRCPLCNIEVFNPAQPWQEPSIRPYPKRLEVIMHHIDRRYFAGLASLLLLIPMLVTLLIDFLFGGAISWSAYVLGAGVLFFIAVILPFFFKKPNIYLCLSLNTIITLLYLWLIDIMDPTAQWFLPLAMPITLVLALLLFGLIFTFRGRLRSFWSRGAAILFAAGLYTVCIELLISAHLGASLIPVWSGFCLIPCWIVGVILLLLRGRKRLREEIHRRLFV